MAIILAPVWYRTVFYYLARRCSFLDTRQKSLYSFWLQPPPPPPTFFLSLKSCSNLSFFFRSPKSLRLCARGPSISDSFARNRFHCLSAVSPFGGELVPTTFPFHFSLLFRSTILQRDRLLTLIPRAFCPAFAITSSRYV